MHSLVAFYRRGATGALIKGGEWLAELVAGS